MLKNPFKKIIFLTLVAPAIFSFTGIKLFAAVMTSSSYKIQSDSVNFGGNLSDSANYKVEDTLGEIATGESESSNYKLKAGYQQMQEVYIAISGASNISMTPSIGSTAGGSSNGSITVTVTTDGVAGYQLSLKASSSPALQSTSDSFADYTPGSDPDFSFSISASASEFGFTPEGNDIVQNFKDNGTICNTGALDTLNACWAGLSTSNQTVSQSSAANIPSGTETVLKFRAESGSSHVQTVGTYGATTTLTAVAL